MLKLSTKYIPNENNTNNTKKVNHTMTKINAFFTVSTIKKNSKLQRIKITQKKCAKIWCGVDQLQGATTLSREATVHIKVY